MQNNNNTKGLILGHTIDHSKFTWDDLAKPFLNEEEFRREQLNEAEELLSNITDILGFHRLSLNEVDRVFGSIISIYEQYSDLLWTDENYIGKFGHIKTKNKPQTLKDDLYECTYLMIKKIVYDEVDAPMQDMVLNKIIEISK